MSDKKEVNCLFAVHFEDKDDTRYQAIAKIMMGSDMWTGGNLIYAAHLDSRDKLTKELEKLESEAQDD